ncbi:MAG: hypothetical protein J6P83_07435 [Bacteroidales bacterium]|nr:hypothetical protein [Bacteroidales bacterium]
MQHKMTLVSLFFIGLMVASCDVERSEKYQALLAERDSLYTEAVASKGGFDNALNTINEIEAALEAVRVQENIIMMENQEGNTNKAVSEINAIQQTLQENRQKISQLEKQLAEQGASSKALNETVSRLKKQLEEKDTYINSLKDELQQSKQQIANLNEQVSDLNENINELNSNLDVMSVQNAAQQATIENQDVMLNTVWVCIAPQKTLIEKGVLSKGGLFSSSEISKQGFDKSQFEVANKRDLELIPLNTKKPKIMTTHPEGSYQLNEGEGGALTLQILDKEAFWSMSNYLVVSIK